MLIASTYKFSLAIENRILRDYCTEKFFQGFMTSTVMVRPWFHKKKILQGFMTSTVMVRPWFHVVSFLIEFSLKI